MTTHAQRYLAEAAEILSRIDGGVLERMAKALHEVRERGGRLFFVGVGGGAANASHAASDFRKLAGFEAYCVTENVAELTARINDEGWDNALADMLRASRLRGEDALFVLSVGGGSRERNISVNLVEAIGHARSVGAAVLGVVGRDGGQTARHADACVIVPTVNPEAVTPHTESFQALVCHLLVTHPLLQRTALKWESSAPVRAAAAVDRVPAAADALSAVAGDGEPRRRH